MDDSITYLAMTAALPLAGGHPLADRTQGYCALCGHPGFTPLTETLVRELGRQRGAEELTRYLNLVYDAVIDELHRYGGSVIAFAGDAITCWIDGDDGARRGLRPGHAASHAALCRRHHCFRQHGGAGHEGGGGGGTGAPFYRGRPGTARHRCIGRRDFGAAGQCRTSGAARRGGYRWRTAGAPGRPAAGQRAALR
ncbi:MAG: hypothetical protein R2911_21790 [Caldilineaceae bacterium]